MIENEQNNMYCNGSEPAGENKKLQKTLFPYQENMGKRKHMNKKNL